MGSMFNTVRDYRPAAGASVYEIHRIAEVI